MIYVLINSLYDFNIMKKEKPNITLEKTRSIIDNLIETKALVDMRRGNEESFKVVENGL